ncbi:MAG: DUF1343 domain-containing protein [Gemmatimonadetes bacterium]|nr:DUF1343 domain-containing protein [Gemmatimonadota bacterium]
MKRPFLCTLLLCTSLLASACTGAGGGPSATPTISDTVQVGADVLLARPLPLLTGKRAGLITNQTGVARDGRSTIDVLAGAPGVQLVALFSPEHGIRGAAAPGERVASGVDERTGLPIHSLYGDTRKPTPEMLRGIDVLVFDIQDIGARPYTYIYTMALGMEAARDAAIPFVVLDRPNPIGGRAVEGNLLDTAFATFVGLYPIPVRHGMTSGELAQMFNREFGIGADLTVVPAQGWRRAMWGDETGQPWIPPSPNIPRLEAAIHYPGTVFFEGTNLSAGRGTSHPFEQTGAPWLRAGEVVSAMNEMGLPGVRFVAVEFTPRNPGDDKFADQPLRGIRLILTDRETYRPVATSLLLISSIRHLHPREFTWNVSHFDRLAGTDRLRLAIEAGEMAPLLREWESEAEAFVQAREPYLLYR